VRGDDQDKSAPPPPAVQRIADKLFLGPEFLTWLYFTLFDEGFEMALPDAFPPGAGSDAPDGGIVRFAIGKRVTLKPQDLSGPKVALSGPGLDNNGEVLQAVRRGALVESLSLDLAILNRVYAFTLNAADGSLSGVKLPDLFSEPEEQGLDGETPKQKRPRLPFDAVLELRMSCLDELERVIDALFARFVTRRVARAWQTEDVRAIKKRVAVGLKARLVQDVS
jgi:hypothetical protein